MANFPGSQGDDYLLGTDGDDRLDASGGYLCITLTCRPRPWPSGNDTLEGGAGNDWMDATDDFNFNDESPDVFVFGPGHGDNTVHGDFKPSEGAQDLIDLSDFGENAPS